MPFNVKVTASDEQFVNRAKYQRLRHINFAFFVQNAIYCCIAPKLNRPLTILAS